MGTFQDWFDKNATIDPETGEKHVTREQIKEKFPGMIDMLEKEVKTQDELR